MDNDQEAEIRARVAAEHARLAALHGVDDPPRHFRRPVERRFTAAERDHVTILFGGLTWKHEELLRSVFEASGYRCDVLPSPEVADCQIGREHGNVGQCNPTYFTVGALIRYLRRLEASGLSRREIADRYVFFTAGTCGPCRFGMYEAEYRLALQNAGFDGFRVLLFNQSDGVKASSGEAGLHFTVDFGLGALNAFTVGDVIHQTVYRVRPYEVFAGETDRAMHRLVATIGRALRDDPPLEIRDLVPRVLAPLVFQNERTHDFLNTLGKIRWHLRRRRLRDLLDDARAQLDAIEVDRLRVKPIVKITGEFWAQTTESDGNFRMFEFLESEGAEVVVDPIGSWVTYLLFQERTNAAIRRHLDVPAGGRWRSPLRLARSEARYQLRRLMFGAAERFWQWHYDRFAEALGGVADRLPPQDELARLAAPFYNPLARGGEGHLEIAKTVYHSIHHHCHMVLSLKPFGCMPSTQSDGAQAAVVGRFRDILFLPIETAADGEAHARSRVQMVLTEAKRRARREFDAALAATGRPLDDIRAFVADRRDLRRPTYPLPQHRGVVGVASNFVLHVGSLMDRKRRARTSTAVPAPQPS